MKLARKAESPIARGLIEAMVAVVAVVADDAVIVVRGARARLDQVKVAASLAVKAAERLTMAARRLRLRQPAAQIVTAKLSELATVGQIADRSGLLVKQTFYKKALPRWALVYSISWSVGT